MDFDFSQIVQSVNDWIIAVISSVISYYESLDNFEYYAWAGVGLGLLFIILGIVL